MKQLIILVLFTSSLLHSFAFETVDPKTTATVPLETAESFNNNRQTAFEENKGQVTGADAQKVKFVYKDQGVSVFLLNNGLAYQFSKTHYPKGYKHLDKFADRKELEKMEALQKKIRVETYRMDVTLVGANSNAEITTEGKSNDYTQYYNHDALNVHSYTKITYHNVYPNIDWVIYKTATNLKYDFIVRPGGDPNQIKLQTNWVEDLTLNQDGSLTLKNRMGSITEQRPISFQGEKEIDTRFKVNNNTFSFETANYDPTKTLIIDPSLLWGTYYGGSDNDDGRSCAVDGSGNVYLAGFTGSTTAIASGGHQNTFGGGYDAFLVKFNSSGVRQWGTYYGGSGYEYVNSGSCAVDASGNVYLAGETTSLTSIASGGHQNTFGGGAWDTFLVKFNSSGVRQWATYYGGSDNDNNSSCTSDASGNVYLVGETSSSTNIAFGGHQNTNGGDDDAFLVKFDSNGVRQWSTYYGGFYYDYGKTCAVDASGNVYLAGQTASTSSIALGGHQNTFGGGSNDAFLVKFNSSGVRQWSTYYGGSSQESFSSCAFDVSGNVYLAGLTASTSSIASGGHQNTIGGSVDAFLVKFNSSGVRQWGTYYGSTSDDYGFSCATDASGNVYLAGYTASTSLIASGGHQNTLGGGNDAFLVIFNSSGVRQWGTYYGGTSNDYGYSCATDASGNVYLAGYTSSTNAISSSGHQNINGGGSYDAFLVKLGDIVACTPVINISSNQGTTICAGTSVIFTASPTNGGSTPTYQWKKNGNNVGTGLVTYTTSTLVQGDVITCELTSSEACASPTVVTSNAITFTVTPVVTPTASISTNQSFPVCAGQAVVFNGVFTNGGMLPTIQWKVNNVNVGNSSPTFSSSSLVDGDVVSCVYTSSNACATPTQVTSNSITVTVASPIVVNILQTGQTLAATTGFASYQWSLNNVVISGATTNVITATTNGNYQVTVTDANGCSGIATYNYNSASIATASLENYTMYPNPTSGNVTISFTSSEDRTIQVYDMAGKIVYTTNSTQEVVKLNLEDLVPSMYNVIITNQNGIKTYDRLMIKK